MKNKPAIIGGAVVIILMIAAFFFWSSRGYGKVSEDAYEIATALHGTCMAESEERLKAVSLMLSEDAEKQLDLTDAERDWLGAMIQDAEDGNWKDAAASARQMMEDQVDR